MIYAFSISVVNLDIKHRNENKKREKEKKKYYFHFEPFDMLKNIAVDFDVYHCSMDVCATQAVRIFENV